MDLGQVIVPVVGMAAIKVS